MAKLRVIYDGDCPFCSRYVQLMRIRENFDVTLINARDDLETAQSYGLDLNEGMIADLDGDVYHGADAMWLLSCLAKRPGLFRNRTLARLSYPLLRAGRNLVLRLLGRKKI